MDQDLVICWFRRDLRTNDHHAFFEALRSGKRVLPVFIFDTHILQDLDNTDARVNFIYDEVMAIHNELSDLGSGMHITKGVPLEIFKELISEYPVKAIYCNKDYEPYAKERDSQISDLASEQGVAFRSFKDQVMYEEGEILTNYGYPYKVFTPYKKKWLEHFKNDGIRDYPSQEHLDQLISDFQFEQPSLSELGFKPSDISIPGKDIPINVISDYADVRDYPAKEGTSRLGIHLRFGTVSIREAVQKASDLSDTWLNELIWREFYMMILARYPHVVDNAFKFKYDRIPWINDEKAFDKWCKGKTGYPLVDAGMRQLNETGYMHNRVRMITASFLTKHLLIDWRWGETYFAKKLLDYELASNNGGWQWAAGTGTDAQPYFRIFNPGSQLKKFDKDLSYVKKWVPEVETDDYPAPIVEHKKARERALKVYKEAVGS